MQPSYRKESNTDVSSVHSHDDDSLKHHTKTNHGYGHSFGVTRRSRSDGTDINETNHPSKNEIDWSSIVPSPDTMGITTLPSDEAFSEISRRVRRECTYLCLIPSPDYSGIKDDNSIAQPKTPRVWLQCANSIVASYLNLDSPNPIGWDHNDGDIFSTKTQSEGEISFAYWIIGVHARLRGPQPWQATRSYIANKVYELLEAEGFVSWVTSDARWEALFETVKPNIEQFLLSWRSGFSKAENHGLLQKYSREIWNRFTNDRLKMLNGLSAAIVPLHTLTERYVRLVGTKLEKRETLPKVPLTHKDMRTNATNVGSPDEDELRSILLKKVRKLQNEYFPLLQGGEKALQGVCDKIWERFLAMSPTGSVIPLVNADDVSSTKKIASILNDLEHDTEYLTDLNGLFRLRVSLSALGTAEGEDELTDTSHRSSLASNGVNNDIMSRTKSKALGNSDSLNNGESQPASDDKTWELSTTKEENSRVYAVYKGDWYWGTIGSRIIEKRKHHKKDDEVEGDATLPDEKNYLYTVLFEDGDIEEGLKSKQIITEAEYVNIFKKRPPSPPPTRRNPKRARTAQTNDQPTKIMNDDNLPKTLSINGSSTSSIPSLQHFSTLSTHELQGAMCNCCILCIAPDCERCHVCRNREQDVNIGFCLRKMCCNVPTMFKAQPAMGFPNKNWKFVFDNPHKTSLIRSTSRIFDLAGLKIISPEGRQFLSLESSFAHVLHPSISSAVQLVEKFCSHVGSSRYVSYPTHFLVGKEFCTEFTDVNCQSITLYGVIVGCVRNKDATFEKGREANTLFIAQYNEDVLEITKSSGTIVQPIQIISAESAWGNAIAYERKTNCTRNVIRKIDQATPCETWITPDMRSEEVVEQLDGTRLPQLTIFVRGYKFVFAVKISRIEGKHQYGLFVTCTPIKGNSSSSSDDTEEEINFKPGELVDLGVFSPLGKEDNVGLPVFIIKNYINSFKCGRWAFLSDEDNMVYDLTTDKSAELHEYAARGVQSYVRKCSQDEFPMLNARRDPSGRIHYLFGIPYRGCWKDYESGMNAFIPLFSGDEMEVTISNGYWLPNRRHTEKKTLRVIKHFQPEDILACTHHLESMFPDCNAVKKWPADIVFRSSHAVSCLEERTSAIIESYHKLRHRVSEGSGDDSGISYLGSALESLQCIAKLLESEMKN